MKLGSLFDGIGGFPYAGQLVGITPVWASEIEPFCVKVTQAHFPKMKHYGDITNIHGDEIEPVDIVTFGSPCQDLSIAGKRQGLEGNRSGLFYEAVRVIREMRKTGRPTFALWENVPGALTSNQGHDFRCILEELTEAEVPMPRSGKWANAGMVRGKFGSLAWRCFDAQFWGVPQRRKRIFLIVHFGGQCAPEILFESEGMPGDSSESEEAWEEATADVGDGADTTILFEPRSQDGVPRIHGNICPTLNTMGGGQRQPCIAVTFDGDKARTLTATNSSPCVDRGQNVVFQPVAFQPGNLTRQAGANPSETAFPTLGATTQGDQFPCVAFAQNQRDEVRDLQDKAGTLAAESGMKQQTFVAQPTFAIRTAQTSSNGWGVTKEKSYTLDLANGQAVVQSIAGTVSAKWAKGTGGPAGDECQNPGYEVFTPSQFGQYTQGVGTLRANGGDLGGGSETLVQTAGYAVRRLTPLECERLQGFPDYWTQIGSDTQRYKAIGNSIAIPPVKWILERISLLSS